VSELPSRLSQSDMTAINNEGRLEVYYEHRWRTVCDETFGDDEARVVCFSLRHGFYGLVTTTPSTRPPSLRMST